MDDLTQNDKKNDIDQEDKPKNWSFEQEKILQTWAEMAKSHRWLHDRSHTKYKWQNFWFSIPVIVLSNLTGIANFAQNSIPDENENKRYVPLGIGFINILAGIITTIYQFLKVAELVEGHRSAALSYSKFSRDISVQLALSKKERKYHGKDFLTMKKDEFDGLLEKGPTIPNSIINEYANEFMTKEKCITHRENNKRKKGCCPLSSCCRSKTPPVNVTPKKCTMRTDCQCNKCIIFTKPEMVQIHPVNIYQDKPEKVDITIEPAVSRRSKTRKRRAPDKPIKFKKSDNPLEQIDNNLKILQDIGHNQQKEERFKSLGDSLYDFKSPFAESFNEEEDGDGEGDGEGNDSPYDEDETLRRARELLNNGPSDIEYNVDGSGNVTMNPTNND